MPNQYFAALTNMRSVGVMGDERTYDYADRTSCGPRRRLHDSRMQPRYPFDVLQKVMSRIINEVKGVNRVLL